MTETRARYGATPPPEANRCPDCGAYPAGHGPLVCVQVLKWRLKAAEECIILLMTLAGIKEELEAEMNLKPCPFCGKTDIRPSVDYPEAGDYIYWCGNCGAFGPNDISEAKAREMWNLRRPETALLEACEKVARLAEEIWGWCENGTAETATGQYSIQITAATIGKELTAALAAARPQEEASR